MSTATNSAAHERTSTAPIRIAVCITGLEVGGAETFLSELLKYRPDEFEVRVYALIDGGPIAERIAELEIPVIGLHMQAGRAGIRPLLRLVSEFRAFKPAIVHTWLYHADLLGGLAAKLAGVPHVIWHLHNSDLSPERVRRMTRAVVRVCAFLSHWIPDVIVSCSVAGVRTHKARGYASDRFLVVPNGVDTERFKPSPEARRSLREEFGFSANRPVIGLIARVDPQKNHQGFFEAVRIFFERGGDAEFLLAGRDVEPGHWQLSVWAEQTGRADRITFAGQRADVPRLLAGLDVLTSSSLGEAFPLIVVEGMSSGVPCVATNAGDSALMVADTGIVVPSGDASELADAWMEMLALSAEDRAALGERARDRALRKYAIVQITERMWDLYREVVRGARPGGAEDGVVAWSRDPAADGQPCGGSPLFSVVMACLNAERHIAGALDSVAAQDFEDYEMLVIDGGSTDGTLELVRERESAFGGKLRVVSEPDRGLYDAMNKGLYRACGRYVVYLGADDRLAPGALAAVASALQADDAADIVCGGARVVGPDGSWLEPASTAVRRGMAQRAPARHQSIYVRRSALRSVGGFDTRFRIAADYDAYLRLLEGGASQRLIDDELAEFALGGVSSTSAHDTAADYRDVRIAHGANRFVESVVMRKSILGVRLHALAMKLRGGREVPERVSRGRRLRVLVVSLGRRGGVTEYGFLMSRALMEYCDVAAISSADAENRQRWPALGIPHLEVATFTGVFTMLLSSLAFWRFSSMRTFAREFRPDVIYYPGGHAWKPILGFILPRSAITVLTVHDPELHRGEDTLSFRLLAAVNRLRVYGYVLLNESQKQAFIDEHNLPPTSVTVIPHGVFDGFTDAVAPLTSFEGLEAIERVRGRFALFVGRIQRYKGIDTLLAAYLAVPSHARMPLVIAGSGDFTAAEAALLKQVRSDDVFVVNRWLSDAEVASLVDAARFVILPYNSATQSGVIPLASVYGTPAIASDTGGIAEQVVDGDTGMLFPAGDIEALASTLAHAFELSESDYSTMSRRAREYANANWSWSVLARRLLDFFEALRGW